MQPAYKGSDLVEWPRGDFQLQAPGHRAFARPWPGAIRVGDLPLVQGVEMLVGTYDCVAHHVFNATSLANGERLAEVFEV